MTLFSDHGHKDHHCSKGSSTWDACQKCKCDHDISSKLNVVKILCIMYLVCSNLDIITMIIG